VVESAGYTVGGDEDAEGVSGAGDEAGYGPDFGSLEDVGKFRKPLVLIDGGALARGEAICREAEDGVGQVI
jgi:hypothetical protein